MAIRVCRRLSTSVAVLLLAYTDAAPAGPMLAEADRAFDLRAEKVDGDVASSERICEAITRLEEVLATDEENLEASWKLLRALYYRGEYTGLGQDERQRLYNDAVVRVERFLDRLHGGALERGRTSAEMAAEVRGSPEAAAVHFWAAMHWGLWGETQGPLLAVRKGVAKRVRLYAEVSVDLDERYENGGGLRLLGRLHSVAPRVPLLTGWVSRERAVELLDRALVVAPVDFFNRLYLGEALVELVPERRVEGVEMLRHLVEDQPRTETLLEDRLAQRQAEGKLLVLGRG